MRFQKNKLLEILILSVIAPYLWSGSVHSGSAPSNMTVSATVVRSGSVSTTLRALGHDTSNANTTSDLPGSVTISVALTKSASATIGLGKGNHSPGSLTTGAVSNGTEPLGHEVNRDAGFTLVRTASGVALLDAAAAVSSLPQNFVVRLPVRADQNDSVSVVIVVNF